MTTRTTAALMIAAAVVVNVAFTGLGAVFDYPAVLRHPAGEVLASFREHQAAVSTWFVLLAIGAALLAPVAIGVGRLSPAPAMRWAVRAGIAAAAVHRGVPFLLLTGYGRAALPKDGLHWDAHPKPFDPAQLTACLAQKVRVA